MSRSSFEVKQQCDLSQEEMYKRPKKQMNYESGKQQGSWTYQEHLKYIVFMELNINDKKRKMHKKTSKLFKIMSKFIGTRNLLQCRSHHQKLQIKYRSIRIMIEKEKNKFNPLEYEEMYLKSLQQVNTIYQLECGGKQPFFCTEITQNQNKNAQYNINSQHLTQNFSFPEQTVNQIPIICFQPIPFIFPQTNQFCIFSPPNFIQNDPQSLN